MFSVCNNGPLMAVLALGVASGHYSHTQPLPRAITAILGHCIGPLQPSSAIASGHYSHPRAIITDLEHITGPI